MKPNPADPWHYGREQLATSYLSRFDPGPAESLVLFGERRVGKTSFLRHDLAPVASEAGLQPIYVDLWAHRADPGRALADGLEAAARRVMDPNFKHGKLIGSFADEVTSIGALGVSLSFKSRPEISGPPAADSLSRIAYWGDKLVAESKRPIVLMVDEVQTLATAAGGVDVASGLRALLQRHGRMAIRPVFTGSSRDGLTRMFNESGASFYRYGSALDFPSPDDGIAAHFAARLKESSGIRPPVEQLVKAYHELDRRPGALREMVEAMDAAADANVEKYLQRQIGANAAMAEARAGIVRAQLKPVDVALLRQVSEGRAVFGTDSLHGIAEELGVAAVNPRTLNDSLNRLRAVGLVTRLDRGTYEIEDREAAHALLRDDVLEPRISPQANATVAMKTEPGYITLSVNTTTAAFQDIGRDLELARVLDEAAGKVATTPVLREVFAKLTDMNGNKVGVVEFVDTPPLVDPSETGVANISVRAGSGTHNILREMADSVRAGEQVFVVRDPEGVLVGKFELRDPMPAPELARDHMRDLENWSPV